MRKLESDYVVDQKIVVVTGAFAGIGFATACKFLEDGAHVIAIDLPTKKLEDETRIATLLRKHITARFDFIPHDFHDVDGIQELGRHVYSIISIGRPIDVLVNNHAKFTFGKVGLAGTGSRTQTDRNVSVAEWQQTFDVNVVSYAKLIEVFAPMMRTHTGAIINLCSTGSFHADAENICYNASKAAVAHLTRCAAKDLAQFGIRVNGVAPGSILTQASLNHMRLLGLTEEEGKKRFAAESLLNRQGKPEEIADVISFLASEKAAFIVGQIITVDGGALL